MTKDVADAAEDGREHRNHGDKRDEQMAALNMAVFVNGMNRAEIARWTQAMINSGETMSFRLAEHGHREQALHGRRG